MKKTLCWLVVAAALTMGMAACSSDADSIAEPTIQEPAPTSLHITVGAGIANDNATTRADVEEGTNSNGKATHTLKFTTGDRLYFSKLLENGKFLAGWLTMDGSPSSDGLSATFSGTVKPYNLGGEEISYNLSGIDPLAGSNATLLPKDAPAGFFDDSWHFELFLNDSYSIASDVNTLMKTALYVKGDYDGTQQRFNLTKQYPILNCALGGLTPNTAYTVLLRFASDELYYNKDQGIQKIIYASKVTADGVGNVRFAISGNQNYLTWDRYWVVQLSSAGHTKDYVIGQKTFEPKIYNLTRDLENVPITITFTPSFFRFDENNGGTDLTSPRATKITISGNRGTWEVTPTAPATSFDNSSMVLQDMYVDPGETLSFKAENVTFNYKSHEFVSTFSGTYTVPETIGASLNLGTVRMECADGAICTFIVNFNGKGWLTEITVSDGTNSKTLTDLTYDSGSEVTMLLPTAMNNKTLTVTATYRTAAVGGGTYTYVGTIPNATITADGPNNLGEVTLTKQQ